MFGDSETAEDNVTQQNGILKIDKVDKGNKLKKTNWSLILIYIILGAYACNVVGECAYNNWAEEANKNKEENVCLGYFIKDKCDITNINKTCQEYMDCFKGDNTNLFKETLSLLDMFVQ